MHLVDETAAVPLRDHAELLTYFDAGKPASQWRAGTELELVGVIAATGEPPPYEGPHGIGALLQWFSQRGNKPVIEHGHAIALERGKGQISIEPGGQFELAAPPYRDDRDFVTDLRTYVNELRNASKELGLAWLSTGLRPFGGRGDVPWMPKERYDVMRAYMPTVGTRGLDMMLRTATVQVNLDFSDEADAAAKMRCLYSVTSILTALYAASPIVEDKVSGYQSYRAYIWRDTDRQRSGLMPFVFEPGDSIFAPYTQWALDVPMYFVYRGGYKPVPADLTFRKYMAEGWNGQKATMEDWALHLSTLFPEGRLKKFIEVRGCDCGSLDMIQALAPFMRGLLYDQGACEAATQLMAHLSFAQREELAEAVPRQGLRTPGMHDLAKELVAISREGLSRIAPEALPLISPIEEIAATGRTQSDRIIELWERHAGDRAALIKALAHPNLGPQ